MAKVLAATGASIGDFVALMGEDNGQIFAQRFPLVTLSECQKSNRLNQSGGKGLSSAEEVCFPSLADETAFAIEVDNDSCKPIYRNGDVLLVSPDADVRKGDRIAVGLASGEVLLKQLSRDGVRKIELQDLGRNKTRVSRPRAEVAWMARIVWAAQ